MSFRWKRLTEEDVERLSKKCGLEPIERRIIELLREGKPQYRVGMEVGYSLRSIERHSKRILEKILKEL